MTRHTNFGNDMRGLHSILNNVQSGKMYSTFPLFPRTSEKEKLCLHLFTIFSLKILPATSVAKVIRQNYATVQLRDKCKRTKTHCNKEPCRALSVQKE